MADPEENYSEEMYELNNSIDRILNSEASTEELQDDFQKSFDYGGLSLISHFYGLNKRESQFDELFNSYREFYRVKDMREGSRLHDEKLTNLMEAYREFFGPGSNEQWNEGVEMASKIMASGTVPGQQRPLEKGELRDVLKEF